MELQNFANELKEKYQTLNSPLANQIHLIYHDEYGYGVVSALNKKNMMIRFENYKGKFDISDYFNGKITTEDKILKYEFDKRNIQKQEYVNGLCYEAENTKINVSCFRVDVEIIEELNEAFPLVQRRNKHLGKLDMNWCDDGLVGKGAFDINFVVPEDFIITLGYLACNGHFTADIHEDRSNIFYEKYPEELNPNVRIGTYPTDYEKGINRNAMYTIEIRDIDNFPHALLGTSLPPCCDGRELKDVDNPRIIRTAFVRDLVDNYGFTFSDEQDIDKIRECIGKNTKREADYFVDIFDKVVEQIRGNRELDLTR